MVFFRLLKPSWGQKFLIRDGEKIKNPDFVEAIKGDNTIEGVFDEAFVQQKNAEGYNIYWFPNHPSENIYSTEKLYINGRDIDVFDFVFVDMDLKDGIYKSKEEFLETVVQFPLKPSMIVNSGNGVHVYWRVSNLTRDIFVALQKRLIQYFKTDESVYTVLQLMRFPQGFNTKKHGEPKEVQILEELCGGGPYKVKDLDKALPELTEKNAVKVQNHLDKLDGKTSVELGSEINSDELPDKFLDLLFRDEKVFQLFSNPKQSYGDRSGADASLANILFSKNFNRKEAIAVLANTQKALLKGPNRMDYAVNTVEFAYGDRIQNKFKTVAEKLKAGRPTAAGERVHGPEFFDCTKMGWRKGQLLGIIAGAGVGKTSVALKMIQEMIRRNDDRDDVYVFFSLEMPEYEIEERWIKLVGKNSPLAEKLYVIGNEDEKGQPRNISLQDIYWYASDIRKNTGKEIGAFVIDHVHIVNRAIDTTKEPTFEVESETGNGFGKIRALSLNKLCDQLKPLAKMLNTFGIILTQTSKGKGAGDTPIGIDGAYGISNYEWNMDFIISCFQPLMRIQKDTDLRILAWQYCKIRGKHKDDPISTYEQQVLTYEMESGDLRPTSGEEFAEFQNLLPLANEARKANERKDATSFSRGPNIKDLQKLKLA